MQAELSEVNKKKSFHFPKWLSFLKDIRSDFYYFLFLLLLGTMFFAYTIFTNYLTTPFTGDYVLQQYAFYTNGYDDWWHFLTTGQFVYYDTNTFLGASNIGSNTFYYLTDIFFLPILLFPRDLIPQGIVILTIIKMALAGYVFTKYLKYLKLKRFTQRLGGVAYAFSGWIAWYLWFNHFTGVAVLFPLILLGVEKILQEKKPWLLMISIFFMGLTNYFFFFTFVLCGFFYAMFRFFQRIRTRNAKENWKILGIGFFGFLTGLLLASIIVIPALAVSLQSPRAANTYLQELIEALKVNDWGTFFNKVFNWGSLGVPYKTAYPLINFIFPVSSDFGGAVLNPTSYDTVGGSFFVYSPFTIFLVPAVITSIKYKKISHLIAVALFILMIFTPFTYYAMHGFTTPYCRWNLFAITILITYVSFYIDRIKEEPKWHVIVGGLSTVILTWGATGLAVLIHTYHSNVLNVRFVVPQLGTYGFLMVEAGIITLYVIVVSALLFVLHNKKLLMHTMMLFISAETMATGALMLYGHQVWNYADVNNGYFLNAGLQTLVDQVSKDDPTYYRSYSTNCNQNARNDSMRHNYNGLGTFHSVYNYNVAPFLNWQRVMNYTNSYSGYIVEKRVNLDAFLGVKYYYLNKESSFYGNAAAQAMRYSDYHPNAPLGFVDVSDKYPSNYYYVFENKHHIDFAFAFDKVASYELVSSSKGLVEPTSMLSSTIDNEVLYLSRAVISSENLKYVEGKVTVDPVSTLSYEMHVPVVPSNTYSKKYYDVGLNEQGIKQDGSSYSFTNQLLDLSAYPYIDNRPSSWDNKGQYVTEYLVTSNAFPYDENGMIFYIKNNYLRDYRINLYLVVEEDGLDKFYTFDNHNDATVENNYIDRKDYRGVYIVPKYDTNGNAISSAPRLKKVIIASRYTRMSGLEFYYETATSYYDRLEAIKQNPINDIHYSTNHFDFKTNYDSPKVIVTQLPYEKGWTVTAIDNNGVRKPLDVFKAQGGFTAFVAETGEQTYSMDYYTHLLKESKLVSALGEALFAFSYAGYIIYKYLEEEKKFKKSFDFERF